MSLRPIEDIVRDAEGFSKTKFYYDPPHAEDRGVGLVADYVTFEGRLLALVDGDDEDSAHVISDDIEPHVAEPMARLLNDVGPLAAKVKELQALLTELRPDVVGTVNRWSEAWPRGVRYRELLTRIDAALRGEP